MFRNIKQLSTQYSRTIMIDTPCGAKLEIRKFKMRNDLLIDVEEIVLISSCMCHCGIEETIRGIEDHQLN